MTVKLGVVMDPIADINVKKDTTLAMLLAAQRRGWELYYMEQSDLSLDQGLARATVRRLSVEDNPESWFEVGSPQDIALSDLDVVLMRKDPPFDMDFIYSTYILEAAQREDHRVDLVGVGVDAGLALARGVAPSVVGATDPAEIAFGQNMTSLTFSFSRALAQTWNPGDEIVVTALDHDANISPWVLAARDAGDAAHPAGLALPLHRHPRPHPGARRRGLAGELRVLRRVRQHRQRNCEHHK